MGRQIKIEQQKNNLKEGYYELLNAWDNLGQVNCDEIDCDECPLDKFKIVPCMLRDKKLY